MNRKLTTQQRVFVLQCWWKTNKNSDEVVKLFVEKFPQTPAPSRQAIYNLNKRFETTGSVHDLPRSGRPNTAACDENVTAIAESVIQSPKKSVRKRSAEFDIPRSSVHRIMKSLKLKAYRPQLHQGLTEDDFDRRVEFSEWFVIRCEAELNFQNRILWTDEASFKLNGCVNRHNCVYWSDTNPHELLEQELNVPGVNVWAGVWSGGIVGPYFFNGTVTGASYLEMLQDVVLPELQNNPLFENTNFIWQQDGAPPHYSLVVRECISSNFDEWIGRRGTTDWPPRSCDLTPLDFGVWGIVKNNVFSQKPRDLEHLRAIIEEEFEALNNNKYLCTNLVNSVKKRCEKCIEVHGKHFEQLL